MERRAVIQQKLATLPDELARIAVYYYLDEMTHEEIARVMGCSRRHIGNLVQRLGKRLMRAETSKCPTI
jgi:RNA polymerase sigma-70 factor (ECF subfamily)